MIVKDYIYLYPQRLIHQRLFFFILSKSLISAKIERDIIPWFFYTVSPSTLYIFAPVSAAFARPPPCLELVNPCLLSYVPVSAPTLRISRFLLSFVHIRERSVALPRFLTCMSVCIPSEIKNKEVFEIENKNIYINYFSHIYSGLYK